MSNIIYADLEWLIDIPYWYSVSTIWTFDGIENNRKVSRGEDYMKKFYESLKEHAMNKKHN